ncbi:hypothetical protein [Enhydrobacter sp.]|uniref:hypothetical protein n=1 Tax=Enhydrobacter sp. TaxID=1894999 RepID=UPI002627E4CE|nr:hypothetical protein [Enhydrobacter sp.]
MKRRKLATSIAVALIVLGVAIWGGYAVYQEFSPTEKALADLRRMPLMGLAIADHPEFEDRLREALREEARNPTTGGPTRPLQIVGELRRDVIAPVLRNADDASVVAAMAARVELVKHLQKADPPACREFAIGGISRPDKLDAEGRRLFRNVLVAMEAAYRSGRSGSPQPVASRDKVRDMLREAGFAKSDFDKLDNFATLSNDASCEVELKIDAAPPLLPADQRGPFSRFIVAR